MSVYTVPALNAVDFALTAHTVPSLASPETALQAYTVLALNAVDFALTTTTPPTYMDVGWDLLPDPGGGPVEGSASQPLGTLTQSVTGRLLIQGLAGQTLGTLTQSATGALLIQGASSVTLGTLAQTAAGALVISGAAAQSLGDATQAAVGAMGSEAAPVTPPVTGSTGGGGAVLTYRLNPRRFEVRKAIDRARRELEKARTPKAKKRRLRKAVEMVAEVFDTAAIGYADVQVHISLRPLAEAMSAVETLARRIDLHAEMNATQAKELQTLFVAYQRELERIERQEEEDAVAALMALSTVIH